DMATVPRKSRRHRASPQPENGGWVDRNPDFGSPWQQFIGIGQGDLATDLGIGRTAFKKPTSHEKGETVLGLPFVPLPTCHTAAVLCFGGCQTGGDPLAFALVDALPGPLGRYFWPPGPKIQKVGPPVFHRPFGLS